MFSKKRLVVFLLDTFLVFAALSLSFLMRFDFSISRIETELFWQCAAVVMIVKPFFFIYAGFYRSLWRYASVQDALEIFKGVTIATVVAFFVTLYFRQFAPIPRSIFILDWFFLVALVSVSRLLWRLYREQYILRKASCGPRTLIVGAGDAGSMLLKEIRKQPQPVYDVIGFVDDDKEKRGMKLHGVKVLGDVRHLKALIRKYEVENVIIAMPSANKGAIRGVLDCCQKLEVRFKTLPGINELIDGTVSVSSIKDVDIEDLLGRDPVILDERSISNYLTGKKVLISGAAGSIGSEICRQVAHFKPMKLVLLENAETPLYHIEKELTTAFPELPIVPVICDVRNQKRVETIFDEFTPEVVFHAAAYKHVPMMEYNPAEAVTNNCGGTKVLADVSRAFRVKNFVMISTDKAVNPTNIMGATKRVSEGYVQAISRESKTCFTTVRFGNVLGSNGSVIPLFKEQIRNGGPVTVTDKRVIRYFMTIPEASQLVLQAGCLGTGGDIFVLDMGEPVRILDLAEELIRLSGFTPYEDIDIVFAGLRPGEKLFEELLIDGEGIKPTSHKKIKILEAVEQDEKVVQADIELLLKSAYNNNVPEIMALLKKIVPEFRPSYSFNGEVPRSFCRLRPDLFPAEKTIDQATVIPLNR